MEKKCLKYRIKMTVENETTTDVNHMNYLPNPLMDAILNSDRNYSEG